MHRGAAFRSGRRLHRHRGARRDHGPRHRVARRGAAVRERHHRLRQHAQPGRRREPRDRRRWRTSAGMAADPTAVHEHPAGSDGVGQPTVRRSEGERHPVHGDPERAVRRAERRHRARATARASDDRSDHAGQRTGDLAGDGRHARPCSEVTTLAPPVGAYSPSSGSIAVKVFDSTGAVAQNINVQVAGPTNQTQQTTTEGCAYFAFLTPGTYTVRVIEGTGVGDQEVARRRRPRRSRSARPHRCSSTTTRPATITGTFAASRRRPRAGCRSRSRTPACSRTVSSRSRRRATTTTSPSLFPYASGYTVFAGQLHRQQPARQGHQPQPSTRLRRRYRSASPPNGSATTTVPLYPVALHVQNARSGSGREHDADRGRDDGFAAPYTAICTTGTATAPRRRSASPRRTPPATASPHSRSGT